MKIISVPYINVKAYNMLIKQGWEVRLLTITPKPNRPKYTQPRTVIPIERRYYRGVKK